MHTVQEEITFSLLDNSSFNEITFFLQQLNDTLTLEVVIERQKELNSYPNYKWFGLFANGELVGITGGWITMRIYSGKQLEIDNVTIHEKHQSKGYGKILLEHIENWAIANDFLSIELNTYINNYRSHKFYFNKDYKILGFHFQKTIGKK